MLVGDKPTYNLIIAGSRKFGSPVWDENKTFTENKEFNQAFHNKWKKGLELTIDEFLRVFNISPDEYNIVVFSGKCKGIDTLGEEIAKERGWEIKEFPANFKKLGKKAGPLRNQQMIDAGAHGVVILCLENSKGSLDMEKRADGALDMYCAKMPDGDWIYEL